MLENLPLETPHSGYHWDGSDRRFFEGWYFRVTLPAYRQTFAFMYSIDDPLGGTANAGGCAQILGPDDSYFCRTFPDVAGFWATPRQLGLGHWGRSQRVGMERGGEGREGREEPEKILPPLP